MFNGETPLSSFFQFSASYINAKLISYVVHRILTANQEKIPRLNNSLLSTFQRPINGYFNAPL